MRRSLLPVAATLVLLSSPATASAQVAEAGVREVLETSRVRNVLGDMGSQLMAAARTLAPDIDTLKLAPVVHSHFAEDSLVSAVTRHVAGQATPELLGELRAWLLADSILTLEAKADVASDSETLEQFVQRLKTERPPLERIQLAAKFADIQRAGEFYVKYVNELQMASQALVAAAQGLEPPNSRHTPEQTAQATQQFRQMAAISFLQRFEPLTVAEVRKLVVAYESRSGKWYIAAYTEAVALAISQAAEKAVMKLNALPK